MTDWYDYTEGDVLDLDRRSPADFIDDIKMEYLKQYLPDQGIIMEVGAGSGRLLTRIGLEQKDKYQIIGMDLSKTSVKTISANINKFGLNGISIHGTTFNIPIKKDSVDVICSGGLLEHFHTNELFVVLYEMFRVLKPGGVFYADIVPRKRSLCRPIIRKNAWEYENNLGKNMWNYLLTLKGFTDINMFSSLILPPDFYGRWAGQKRIGFMYKNKDFIKSLDNTILSDWLGFVYFVFARKW